MRSKLEDAQEGKQQAETLDSSGTGLGPEVSYCQDAFRKNRLTHQLNY
jgi:hypothetical protein